MTNEGVTFTSEDLHALIREKVASQHTGLPPLDVTTQMCIGDENISPEEHPDIIAIRTFAFKTAVDIAFKLGEFDAIKSEFDLEKKGVKQLSLYWDLLKMAELIEAYLKTGNFPLPPLSR